MTHIIISRRWQHHCRAIVLVRIQSIQIHCYRLLKPNSKAKGYISKGQSLWNYLRNRLFIRKHNLTSFFSTQNCTRYYADLSLNSEKARKSWPKRLTRAENRRRRWPNEVWVASLQSNNVFMEYDSLEGAQTNGNTVLRCKIDLKNVNHVSSSYTIKNGQTKAFMTHCMKY